MATREKSKKKLPPPAGTEVQLSLPLDWTSPAEEKKPIYDIRGLSAEIEHACPGCGKNLKRWKGCWVCDGCGYSSCGEAE